MSSVGPYLSTYLLIKLIFFFKWTLVNGLTVRKDYGESVLIEVIRGKNRILAVESQERRKNV